MSFAADAGMPIREEVVCPVGGERFSHVGTASYSTFGSRPDGKPYGSWIFPMPLPVCPGNGLPVWRTFDPAETKRLEALLKSPEWRALDPGETPYWRAHWLARRLEPESDAWRFLLLQAGWEADASPARRAAYLAQLIPAAEGVPSNVPGLSLQLRAANALRELSRFEEAIAALDAVDARIATFPAASDEQRNIKEAMAAFSSGLRAAVMRRDSSIELLELTGGLAVMHRCTDRALGEKLPDPTGACDAPNVRKWVQEALAREAALEKAGDAR